MLSEFLLDLLLVLSCAAAATLAGLAFKVRGAAAMGVAASAIAVMAIQSARGGLREIGLSGPPDLGLLAPYIAGGLAGCFLIAALASYAVSKVGLSPDITRLDFIKGSPLAFALMMTVSWTTAAFGEEIVFRGFLLNRAASLDFGIENWTLFVLIAQAALFGLAHAYQGLGGVIVTGVLGLALGVLTLLSGGNLWPAIIVHGLINTVSLTALFLTPARSDFLK